MNVAGYPVWAENWWLSRLRDRMQIDNLTARHPALESAIQKLTNLFTTERAADFPDYFSDEFLQIAYGLFFFPRNFVRIQFPLAELIQRGWSFQKHLKILDLGAGTGASALGAAHQLFASFPDLAIELHAADKSMDALQVFKSISDEAPYKMLTTNLNKIDFAKDDLKGEYDLILLSFALNEDPINETSVHKLKNHLRENGALLIVEPATKEASERLEQLRDRIAFSNDLYIWGPCLHRQPCPLLADGKFWCHEVRNWNPPESLEILNRHLYRTIATLKFSFLVLGRNAPMEISGGPGQFRLIAPWIKTKGKWITSGCASDGRNYQYEVFRRDAARNQCISANRGDILNVKGTKLYGSSTIRIESEV